MSASYPRIPYGVGNFGQIRREGLLYVDKTRFVRALEDRHHIFFIRPRRFGKTCWISLLESYYDRTKTDCFDALFAGTDIGADPTRARGRYVVLRLNFSGFRQKLATLEQRFEEYCAWHLRSALRLNRDLFPAALTDAILSPPDINGKLDRFFTHAGEENIPVYVLIDEYDNFANTILAHHGRAAYEEFTHGEGFYRSFFTTLKVGAEQGGIERLFMTGVSPITLDDVTSGFNIADNISLDPAFSEMAGFTEAEVRTLLEMYRDLGVFNHDPGAALATMRDWYGEYRFSKRATPDVYNTDMVLYYLKESIPNRPVPDDLIDDNVRIDYGKLRHLMLVSRERPRRLNGNFDILRHLVGKGRADAAIRRSFPLEHLTLPENFLSLLYYFGLLGIQSQQGGASRLGIPNQTVRHLLHGYIREAYRDVGLFTVDLHQLFLLVSRMAFRGEWRPVVDFLANAINEQTAIRDYIAGEKVLQGFLAAYFGLSEVFLLRSEAELAKGYADLLLEPFTARYPDIGFGYVIELKYLKRGAAGEVEPSAGVRKGHNPAGEAGAAREPGASHLPGPVAACLADARAQLCRYLADPGLRARHPSVRFTGLALVFYGWELVACEAVEAEGRGRSKGRDSL